MSHNMLARLFGPPRVLPMTLIAHRSAPPVISAEDPVRSEQKYRRPLDWGLPSRWLLLRLRRRIARER